MRMAGRDTLRLPLSSEKMRRAKKKGRAPQTPPRPSPAGEGEANLLSGLLLLAGEVVDVWEMFLVKTPPRPSPVGEGEANLLSGLSLLAGEVVDMWEMFLVDNVLYLMEEMA